MTKFIFAFTCVYAFTVNAQDKVRYTINPGEKLVEKIPREEIYRYPLFELAFISFKDGSTMSSWIKYNILFGEMQFIDPNHDTLSIAEEKNIRFIAVEQDSFYFDNGWIEQIASTGNLKLARKKKIEVSNKEKIGGMDIPTFGAVETNTKYTGSQNMKDLVAKEKLTYTVYNTYFIGDKFNYFVPATKKSLLKLYGKKQDKLEDFLDENKIDFLKEDDLRKVFGFINTL